MRRTVLASGLWNLALVPGLALPPFVAALGLRSPHPFWGAMLGAFLAFAGVVLTFASRDLPRRAADLLLDRA